MKNFILISCYSLSVLVALTLAQTARWFWFKNNAKYSTYTIEENITPDKMTSPKPDTQYFKKIAGTRMVKAGSWPWLEETVTAKDDGIWEREK